MRLTHFALLLITCLAGPTFAGDEISDQSMSQGLVPAYLLEVPESVDTILVADASSAALMQFSNTESGVVYQKQRYLSVGLRGVGKERSGDRRTPLGVYFLTEELNTHRLDPKYGAAAFVLDYPNAWDRRLNRTGHGIWLHGVHPKTPIRPPLDTDGCLALPNDQLLNLRPALSMHSTPVIVTRRIEWASRDAVVELRDELRDALARWQAAMIDGNLQDYLALYDDKFRARGMNKREWARFRLASFAASAPARVDIDDLLLVRDPEQPDLYLARFEQTTDRPSGSVSVRKRLYWRKTADGFRVITEDAG